MHMIEVLITDYFSNENDVSKDESDHSEGQSDDEIDSNIAGRHALPQFDITITHLQSYKR